MRFIDPDGMWPKWDVGVSELVENVVDNVTSAISDATSAIGDIVGNVVDKLEDMDKVLEIKNQPSEKIDARGTETPTDHWVDYGNTNPDEGYNKNNIKDKRPDEQGSNGQEVDENGKSKRGKWGHHRIDDSTEAVILETKDSLMGYGRGDTMWIINHSSNGKSNVNKYPTK